MKNHRQLAAIMFTDIEGFSALMQTDEDKAIATRERHTRVVKEAHQKYHGHVVQYYGDGTLSIFNSAVEAVTCALEMQQLFGRGLKVPVRIGMHMGDIVCQDYCIYGDGVNIASRIESISAPGAILVSDKIADELHNHPRLQVTSLGLYEFKNITRQIGVFAVNHPHLVVPPCHPVSAKAYPVAQFHQNTQCNEHIMTSHTPEHTIAILPFNVLSNNQNDLNLAESVAEDILTELTHRGIVKVAASSPAIYGRKCKDYKKIGQKLGVTTVMRGSVRRINRKLWLGIEVVNVLDGFIVWSEKVPAIRGQLSSLALTIATHVSEKLCPYVASGGLKLIPAATSPLSVAEKSMQLQLTPKQISYIA